MDLQVRVVEFLLNSREVMEGEPAHEIHTLIYIANYRCSVAYTALISYQVIHSGLCRLHIPYYYQVANCYALVI